uniref:SprT-like domain-containing protein n=1 Tax=uncultured marine group II/III euryarchaeote KM3_193_A06 TaxID=1457966 RepID=A0A075GXI6_9EURY|nr:hypothetical protein [uncultured marine group II/III euryarchaeote KM3_193_A06]
MDPPTFPTELLATLSTHLTEEEAPFLPYLERELRLEWLDPDSSSLGNTHFEMNHHDLFKRRRLRSPPGPVTIGLHPMLVDDEALLRHTLVHELLHAAGLLEHTERHTKLADEIAPPPTLSSSPVLRSLREGAISASGEKYWICASCGYEWERRTMRKPARCLKCAALM